jgi:hypothetical protein
MTSPFLPSDVARCPGVTIAPVAGANAAHLRIGVVMIECRDCLRRTAPANDPTRVLVMDPPIRALMASITSTDMPTPICDHRIAP